MKLCDKLKKYCTENGIQKNWFAEKIGMSATFFYHILNGKYSVTDTYWKKIIEVTNGQITFADLLEEQYKHLDFVNVIRESSSTKCSIEINIT